MKALNLTAITGIRSVKRKCGTLTAANESDTICDNQSCRFRFFMHLSLGLAGSVFAYTARDSVLTVFAVLKRRTEPDTLEKTVKIGFFKP